MLSSPLATRCNMWIIHPRNGGSVRIGYNVGPHGVSVLLYGNDDNWIMRWEDSA